MPHADEKAHPAAFLASIEGRAGEAARRVLEHDLDLLEHLEGWLDASPDTHLIEELRELLALHEPLGAWIATGALARHERQAHATDFLAALSRGELPDTDPQRQWSARLPARVVEHLIALGEIMRDDIARRLEDFTRLTAPQRDGALATLCQLREDAESLRAIIAAAGGEYTCAALDTRATRMLARDEYVDVCFFGSLRLMRATISHPEAWWTERALPLP